MKITRIRTLTVAAPPNRNWVFVKVETDQPGLYGWGEGTLEWKTRGVVGTVEDFVPILLGQDPRDVTRIVSCCSGHPSGRSA
jgi:galactonate dehydratase